MDQPGAPVDGRTDRVAQGLVGVALLAAFVFRVPWLVPGLALILAVAAVGGPRANAFHRGFESWIAARLPSPRDAVAEAKVASATVRAQDALAAVVLAVAAVAFLLGIGLLGWLFVIAEAVVSIVAATTRIHVADRLRHLLHHLL